MTKDNCPFCGSDNLITERVGDWRSKAIAVICQNCDAVGPSSLEAKEAEMLWNNRQIRTADLVAKLGRHG